MIKQRHLLCNQYNQWQGGAGLPVVPADRVGIGGGGFISGAGGAGGGGGAGSSGGDGGNVGGAASILVFQASVTITNNTLVDPYVSSSGGEVGAPGSGGVGGSGGTGNPSGDSGATDVTPISPALPGSGNIAYGVYSSDGAIIDFYNNINTISLSIDNSIGVYSEDTSTITEDYNNVYGWFTRNSGVSEGSHTINLDPLFISSSDHHLQSTSPCINNGWNDAPSRPSRDHDGRPRPIVTVEMGAYEYAIQLFIPIIKRP